LWAERGVLPSSIEFVTSLLVLPVLVALAIALVLTYEADEWAAVIVIALLPVVLVEFLRQFWEANRELRRRNDERDELLRLIIESGDDQRRLLAGDLHDGPLQTVLACRMGLEAVEDQLRDGRTPGPAGSGATSRGAAPRSTRGCATTARASPPKRPRPPISTVTSAWPRSASG